MQVGRIVFHLTLCFGGGLMLFQCQADGNTGPAQSLLLLRTLLLYLHAPASHILILFWEQGLCFILSKVCSDEFGGIWWRKNCNINQHPTYKAHSQMRERLAGETAIPVQALRQAEAPLLLRGSSPTSPKQVSRPGHHT